MSLPHREGACEVERAAIAQGGCLEAFVIYCNSKSYGILLQETLTP